MIMLNEDLSTQLIADHDPPMVNVICDSILFAFASLSYPTSIVSAP